ncbi:MAG: PBP1A family penicillin-binding protein [Deltaproteobacteria bacterium]|nr:PBP1A family penicillin-binding protein [Deltaproteobacteria bacterium]
MFRKIFKFLSWSVFALCLLIAIASGVFLTWGYFYITRDLPKLEKIEDYRPAAVTRVFDRNGILISEFFTERRYPVKISEVPERIRNAFVAAEDSSFYTHPGVDIVSIARAFIKNLESGSKKQGASTITQQVVKKLLLSPKKDYKRKIKEAILSYRLEQKLSKEEILEIYLNEMYFGNGAYGIKAAAEVYYHKAIADLSHAQAAQLAGLLKAPSRYSPLLNQQKADERKRYVLSQMFHSGFISEQEYQAALKEELVAYKVDNRRILRAPYYSSEIRRVLVDRFGSEREVDTGGYEIYTALDLKAQELATTALRRGLEELDKRRGWRGVLKSITQDYGPDPKIEAHKIYQVTVEKTDPKLGKLQFLFAGNLYNLSVGKSKWVRTRLLEDGKSIGQDPFKEITAGSIIEVSFEEQSEQKLVPEINQTPEVEGAVVLINPRNGEIVSMVGGYDYSRSEFNRITQSLRQPGSAFKPIVYTAAIDAFNYTPAAIVHDEPRTFRVGDDLWTPGNFDDKFLGALTLRTALERSRNLASADIISRIGVESAINYARKMGIETDLGRNLSLSLGSSEVTPLEMTRAYGVLAAKGVLFETAYLREIYNRNGDLIFSLDNNLIKNATQAIDENSAFIMANMMKGVVDHGTGVRVKPIGRPVAGKTGTSNDQMDAWFIGYTPEWVCGIWVGFDIKKTMGKSETGGKAAAPIWLYFMQPYLDYLDSIKRAQLVADYNEEAQYLGIEPKEVENIEPVDFIVPDGVDPYWVDKTTGLLSCQDCENSILEYFKRGTQPKRSLAEEEDVNTYLESGDL